MSKQDDIKKLIITSERRLQKLKEQRALAGISIDPKILLEIEDIEIELAKLEAELKVLKDKPTDLDNTPIIKEPDRSLLKAKNPLLTKIKEVLSREDTVLFIGAGLSQWSGLPSWYGLIEELADFIELQGLSAALVRKEAKRNDLLQAASYGVDQLTKPQFADFIRKVCRIGNSSPHEIHKKIVRLGPKCFITTNYDQLNDSLAELLIRLAKEIVETLNLVNIELPDKASLDEDHSQFERIFLAKVYPHIRPKRLLFFLDEFEVTDSSSANTLPGYLRTIINPKNWTTS